MWRGVYGLTCRGLPIVLHKDSDFDLISNATGQPVDGSAHPVTNADPPDRTGARLDE